MNTKLTPQECRELAKFTKAWLDSAKKIGAHHKSPQLFIRMQKIYEILKEVK